MIRSSALIESLPEIGVVQIYIYPAGRRRVEKMHEFMEEFLKEFYEECNGSLTNFQTIITRRATY